MNRLINYLFKCLSKSNSLRLKANEKLTIYPEIL